MLLEQVSPQCRPDSHWLLVLGIIQGSCPLLPSYTKFETAKQNAPTVVASLSTQPLPGQKLYYAARESYPKSKVRVHPQAH